MQNRSKPKMDARGGIRGRQPAARPQNSRLAKQAPDAAAEATPANSPDSQAGPQMQGVYVISVAARILDVHPQTLRKYERLGLINPGRTLGMLRLYSTDDIRRVRLIQYLSGQLGLNLAGVEFALGMVEKLLLLRQRLGAATQDTPFQGIIEQELSALLESTGLPLED